MIPSEFPKFGSLVNSTPRLGDTNSPLI